MGEELDWALREISNGLKDSMPKDAQRSADIVVDALKAETERRIEAEKTAKFAGERWAVEEKLAEKAEKERDTLNERLARMGEEVSHAGKYLKSTNPHSNCHPEEGHHEPECVMLQCLEKALSSYDPDWMAARLREAKAEAFIEASEMIVEMKLNGGTIAGTIAPVRVLAKQYRQPNQSREKRG